MRSAPTAAGYGTSRPTRRWPRPIRKWRGAWASCRRAARAICRGPRRFNRFSNRIFRDMKARVHITLKNGVLDPQGRAIAHALDGLGFAGVNDVRQGKYIELDLAETDRSKAKTKVEAMCAKLLANMVIENYAIELVD